MNEELDAARARILAQQIQITRLHSALSAIAASGGLADPQVAMARAALEACEADAGQIAQDVRAVLAESGYIADGEWAREARSRLEAVFWGAP